MKKLKHLSIFILLFLITSCGSVPTVTSQKHEKIVRTKGSKNELFVKANEWMVQNFYDENSVIQFSDRENGALAAKRLIKNFYMNEDQKKQNAKSKQKGKWYLENIYLTFKIKVKDDAAKLVIENPFYYWVNTKGYRYPESEMKSDVYKFLNSFEVFMKNSDILDDNF